MNISKGYLIHQEQVNAQSFLYTLPCIGCKGVTMNVTDSDAGVCLHSDLGRFPEDYGRSTAISE